MYYLKSLFLLFFLFLLLSCEKQKAEKRQELAKEVLLVPDFNSDSAFFFLQQQVAFGPRVPNTQSHQLCGDHLVAKLKQYGAKVTEQTFQATAYNNELLNGRNIIAAFNLAANKRILFAAHWDTRPIADQDTQHRQQPIDGANDGASGVAVLLEFARVIYASPQKPRVGIDFIFFDLEDYGAPEDFGQESHQITYCLGSQYWQSNKHQPRYHAYYGILLDMVGGKNTRFVMEGVSMQYAPGVMKKIWDIAEKIGYADYFLREKTPPKLTDDHIFMNRAGIPSIDIIGYDHFNEIGNLPATWHTHRDNLENIDKKLLKIVGQTLLHTLYSE